MDDNTKRELIIALYDIYQALLTEKQRQYFEDYYYMDLSISEISENYNISRNGAFDQIKRTVATLFDYEDKLHLHEKYNKILNLKIDEEAKNLISNILLEE